VSSQTLHERQILQRAFTFVFGTGQRPSLQDLPLQNIHLALVWPILWFRDQPGPSRILDNVLPFLIVTFAPTQLRIPKVPLPDWSVSGRYPGARRG